MKHPTSAPAAGLDRTDALLAVGLLVFIGLFCLRTIFDDRKLAKEGQDK